jgi:hypothetical protein
MLVLKCDFNNQKLFHVSRGSDSQVPILQTLFLTNLSTFP